jgi:hypothetical protein
MGLRLGLTAGLARCLSAGGRAVRERGGDAPEPPAGAGDLHRLGLPSRQEGVDLVVPGEAALGVAEEVQAGRPAAAHQHGVAGDLARRLRVSVRHAGDAQRLHPQAARRAGDGAAEQRLDAERQGAVGQGGVHIQADVDDRDGLRAGLGQVEGCVPGRVVRGDDRRAIAHLDAVALEERLRRAGEHHARPVVAVEDQWLLERALGKDDLLRADLPHPLPRRALGRVGEMVGQPLREADHVLVVVADRRRPGQDAHVRPGVELGEGRGEPVPGGPAVDDDRRLREQRAAGLGGLVDEHDRRPGAAGGERRGEAGGAGADDEHVDMGEAAGIAVDVGLARRDTETGGGADHGLVDAVPQGARPHEGLVVEARREQRAETVADRADVEGERGPAVLAPGLEAVAELLDRGAGVGLEAAWAAGGAHQRVRLVGAGGDDAAGPVVLERPAHEVHPAGEQRRCQRVAGEGLAVEGEADRARVVDAAAALDAVPSHSVPPSGWGGRGGARPPCRSQGTGRRPSRVRR